MTNEKRLIDATEARKRSTHDIITHFLDRCPTVDAVEVVHGRWIDVALRYTQVKEKCSVCGGIVYAHGYNYCPNCGADMRERKSEHEN